MKKQDHLILYIGNKLSKHGFTPTGVEFLGEKLKGIYPQLVTVSSKRNALLRLWDMLYHVQKKQWNHVIIDTYSTLAFWYAYLCAALCYKRSISVSLVLHGGNLAVRMEKSPQKMKFLLKNAKQVISPSSYLKQVVESRIPVKVKVIPNFILLENFPFKMRSNVSCNLLWVRSFHDIYNPEMAIHVLEMLLQENINAKLCMVGPDKDGALGKVKKLVTSKNIGDKVRFTGKTPKKEWAKLSEEYDIFINTTRVDNTPVSLIEAMALGLPVVTTNVGGIPYLIQNDEHGILVNDQDAGAMKNAILKLIRDKEFAQKLSCNGRAKAEQMSWQEVSKKWKEVLS